MWSILIRQSVCLSPFSVCLFGRITYKLHVQVSPNFLYMFSATAWLGPSVTKMQIVTYFRLCGKWSKFTRIKDDAYVLSSSPGGGIGGEVCWLRLLYVGILAFENRVWFICCHWAATVHFTGWHMSMKLSLFKELRMTLCCLTTLLDTVYDRHQSKTWHVILLLRAVVFVKLLLSALTTIICFLIIWYANF